MARPWACLRHTKRLKHTHMGSTTCVVCTPCPQRHGAWYGLPLPRAGTRAPKPCAVSQLMKPWAQCHDSLLGSWKQATSPSHGHLDMAWAHISVWGRHTDAPDAWSDGWCTLLGSEGLDQRHADGHPVTRGTWSQEAPYGEGVGLLGGLSNNLASKT